MDKAQQKQSKLKKALSVSFSPITQTLLPAFMAWLMGTSVNYINIMLSFMLLSTFFSTLTNVNKAFKPYQIIEKSVLNIYKIIYIVCCFVILGLVIYKFKGMGIMPNRPADFISSLEERVVC
ncbi:hypothetical protein QTN25_003272 [Entamoeba marina]